MPDTERKPIISMRQAVAALQLHSYGPDSPLVDVNQPDTYILCPECSDKHQSQRATMNIGFERETFRCHRCGFGGGIYDLIAYYTGWKREDVRAKLANGELVNAKLPEHGGAGEAGFNQKESSRLELAPLSQRNTVYSGMLDRLSLLPHHEEDLLRRGLSKLDIQRIGFKSLPRFMDTKVLPKKLISAGLDLRGVPGFGIEGGSWAVKKMPDTGYLIPLRTGAGLIQGFQIRFDHPSATIPKYGYFTSSRMETGTGATDWISWAGHIEKGKPFDVVITEGPLKGYIVNARTGVNMLSVPGVASLTYVPTALESMRGNGLRTVYLAYDMDSDTNEVVAKHLTNLAANLVKLGIDYLILRWPGDQKGIDDFIVARNIVKA